MKVRNGFVSNSSSSSFTCDVCGETCSGMDMGLYDAGMFECVRGHICCDNHEVGDEVDYHDLSTLEEKRDYLLERAEYESIKEDINSAYNDEDGAEDWLDEIYSNEIESEERYSIPEANCPCCQLDKVSDDDLISYLLHCYGQTKEEVAAEMKKKYGTVSKMREEME